MTASWQGRAGRVERLSETRGLEREEAISTLVETIRQRSHDLDALNTAVDALSQMGEEVAPRLLPLLENSHGSETRIAAVLALGQLGSDTAVESLIALLKDSDANVVYHSVEALGRLKARQAVCALLPLTRGGDPFLAFPALAALALIGQAAVLPELLDCLKDEMLRVEALEAMAACGDELALLEVARLWREGQLTSVEALTVGGRILGRLSETENVVESRWAAELGELEIQSLLDTDASPAEPWIAYASCRLLARLAWTKGSTEEQNSSALCRVLTLLPHGVAPVPNFPFQRLETDALREILSRTEALGRINLATLLQSDTSPSVTPLLLQMMRDDDPKVRSAASESFAQNSVQVALDDLLAFASTTHQEVQEAVRQACRRVEPTPTTHWTACLDHPDPSCRWLAARAAGFVSHTLPSDRSPGELIRRWCEEAEESVRLALLEAALQRGEPIASLLLEQWSTLSGAETTAVATHLDLLPEDISLQLLARCLETPELWTRLRAARFCQSHPEQAAQLDNALAHRLAKDSLPPLRAASLFILSDAPSDFEERYKQALSDPEPEVVRAAWRRLGQDPDERAVAKLGALYLAADPSDREEIITAVRDGKAALALAAEIVRGTNPEEHAVTVLWEQSQQNEAAQSLAQASLHHRRPDWLNPKQAASYEQQQSVLLALRALGPSTEPSRQDVWIDAARLLQDSDLDQLPFTPTLWAQRGWLLSLFALQNPHTPALAESLRESGEASVIRLADTVMAHWTASAP